VADHFFIRLEDDPHQATVVGLNADGRLLRAPETVALSAAAGLAGDLPVTVLLPPADLVSCLANVPAASPGRLRQMLPYSLEDEFAGDIEDLHFAAGERNDSGALAVSVIARDRLDFWLGVLETAGITPRRICSESDAVPDTPGVVTLFVEKRRILGRRPGGAPFAFGEIGLAELWQLLESERETKDDLEHVVLFVDREAYAARREEIEHWRAGIGDVNLKELGDGTLPRLAGGLVHRSGTNLLQGDYAARSNVRALARPWLAAAGFALALIAISVLGTGAQYFKLNREESRLTDQATQICTDRYGIPQLSRCLVEMGRRLADAGQATTGGGRGFLSMLADVANSVGESISISGISYRDRIMTLEVVTPNASYLDAFRQRLTDGGTYAFDTQNSVTQRDGGLQARVRIVESSP
jgi:general secretion pathway protein L